MKFKIIVIDLYDQTWKQSTIEGEDVYDALTKHYGGDEVFKQQLKEDHEKNTQRQGDFDPMMGLYTNGKDGWVEKGEESMVVILPLSDQ